LAWLRIGSGKLCIVCITIIAVVSYYCARASFSLVQVKQAKKNRTQWGASWEKVCLHISTLAFVYVFFAYVRVQAAVHVEPDVVVINDEPANSKESCINHEIDELMAAMSARKP
jgi:hypothetical protein